MKIICIGHNYTEHLKEMSTSLPESPTIFLKPDTAALLSPANFYYPGFSSEIHHEIEIILKINREGKNIAPQFAHKYYDEISVGIDFTARDIQRKCKAGGLPWELAKGFDGSAIIGNFVSKNNFNDIRQIDFHLLLNNRTVQQGNTKNMIFQFEKIISFVSGFITLRKGDILFTGTPQGVGTVKTGDKLFGFIEDKMLLEAEVK